MIIIHQHQRRISNSSIPREKVSHCHCFKSFGQIFETLPGFWAFCKRNWVEWRFFFFSAVGQFKFKLRLFELRIALFNWELQQFIEDNSIHSEFNLFVYSLCYLFFYLFTCVVIAYLLGVGFHLFPWHLQALSHLQIARIFHFHSESDLFHRSRQIPLKLPSQVWC